MYFRLRSVNLELGMAMSLLDKAVFLYHDCEHLACVACMHVEYKIWAGTQNFEQCIFKNLNEEFMIGSPSSGTFKYDGLQLEQNGNLICEQ